MAEDEDEFRHDLIIACDSGILAIPRDVWDNDKYRVDPKEYFTNDGWHIVRDMLECGVTMAVIPPNLEDKPQPLGTCYLVNLEGLKLDHKWHQKHSRKNY